MGLGTQDILLKHVCPGVGVLIAFIMFMSPMKAVLEVNRKKCLGELNALPFIAMAANCAGWVIYGVVTHDFYVYCGNVPGMLGGMFYVLTCYKFSKEEAQDALRNIFLGACAVIFAIGLVDMAAPLGAARKTLWGSTCVAILAVYYTAPLTSLAKVIAQRDSSSLHWPLCLMNVVNGLMWFAYGMAIRDWFISVPNGVGACFNVVCLVFCFVFPAAGRSRLRGEVNPAANWGALRLQSIRRRDGGDGGDAAAAAGRGGFFDLTQLRWRSGDGGGSFFERLASRRESRQQLGGLQPAGGSGQVCARGADDDLKVAMGGDAGLAAGAKGGAGGAGDVERADVTARAGDDAPRPHGAL